MNMMARWRYERAWDRAMAACRRHVFSGKVASRRAAILTIRMFECINRTTFDPLNAAHVDRVSGMASHTELLENLREIHARYRAAIA